MEKIRVLIIDEHPAVCQALAARLRAVPSIEVVGALTSFPETLESVDEARADVVLLDLIDKGEGRYQAGRAILRLLADCRVGVIVLASYMDDMERNCVMRAGARRYLLKDIDTLRLINEIEAVAREAAPMMPLSPVLDRSGSNSRLH